MAIRIQTQDDLTFGDMVADATATHARFERAASPS